MFTSLDPRVTRLNLLAGEPAPMPPKQALDQFETYETFHQRKETMAHTYVGPVHAPNVDVAFLFAKEQYSRRSSCVSLWIALTENVKVIPYAGDGESAYDLLQGDELPGKEEDAEAYEIFHLKKRGKAHVYAGRVTATSYQNALQEAKNLFGNKVPIVNVWVIKARHVLQSTEEDREMWTTVPEKNYREATAYKVMDRIKKFKEQQNNTPA